MYEAMNFEHVGNSGERMTADTFIWSYYAHLSIYRFALPFIDGKNVLDAGSGTGYGSAYLARNGATAVTACDAGADAVAYSKHHFSDTGVDFQVVDLCGKFPYADRSFDVVFSSNVMEHLADIDSFMAECCRVMKPGGVMIIAVPPIVTRDALIENIKNVFHVTNLTPAGWSTKISRYFSSVRHYLHRPTGKWADNDVNMKEVFLPADQVTIREADFDFPEVDVTTLNTETENITAVFVAKKPRKFALAPSLEERVPYDWHEGTLVANLIRQREEEGREFAHAKHQEIARLEAELQRALDAVSRTDFELARTKSELARAVSEAQALINSASWKLTKPIRYLKRAIS